MAETKTRCPFSTVSNQTIPSRESKKPPLTISDDLKEAVRGCPAFNNDENMAACPFQDRNKNVISEIPPSHLFGEGKSNAAFQQVVQGIHEHVLERKESEGELEPELQSILSAGCPFKSITMDGKLLVEALPWQIWPGIDADETTTFTENTDQAQVESVQERCESLSKMLKDGTEASHESARNIAFVKLLVDGKVSQEQYAHLLALLYFVYSALEDALHEASREGNAPVLAMHMPKELERLDAIGQDLEFYVGDSWKSFATKVYQKSPTTHRYVERIKFIADSQPELLVSHSYTRYLGDLSGGRIMQRALRRAFSLPKDGAGVQMFDFPNLTVSPSRFKTEYRLKLDSLYPPPHVATSLVEEAVVAFDYNIAVLKSLDVQFGLQITPKVKAKPQHKKTPETTSDTIGSTAKCPFHNTSAAVATVKESFKPNWFHIVLFLLVVCIPYVAPTESWVWWI